MATVRQKNTQPTNKVTAGTAGTAVWGAIMALVGISLKNLAPEWYDTEVLLAVSTAVPTVINFTVGWLASDDANIEVMVEDPK